MSPKCLFPRCEKLTANEKRRLEEIFANLRVNPDIFTPPTITMDVSTSYTPPVTNIRVSSPFPNTRPRSYPPQGSRINQSAVLDGLDDNAPDSDSDESVGGAAIEETMVQVVGIEPLPLPNLAIVVQPWPAGVAGGDMGEEVVEQMVPVVQLPGPGAGGDTEPTVQVVLQLTLLHFCTIEAYNNGNLVAKSLIRIKQYNFAFLVSCRRQVCHCPQLRQTSD